MPTPEFIFQSRPQIYEESRHAAALVVVEVDAALAWHRSDAMASIATLLADCRHLRQQLAKSRQRRSEQSGLYQTYRLKPPRSSEKSCDRSSGLA
jgi:hypothetical protein